MVNLRIRSDVASINPYRPGKPMSEVAREYGLADIIKLASNESPTEPFPEVVEVIAANAAGVNRYPDNAAFELREALSRHWSIPADHFALGAGSSELLADYSGALGGQSMVYAWPSFMIYPILAKRSASRGIAVELDADLRHVPKAMIEAIEPDTSLVIFCNPNNPTSTANPLDDVAQVADAVADDVLLIVDEAYAEYAEASRFESAIPMALERPNLVVTRTFSKVYGLAGLRCGYAVGHPETLGQLAKMQRPFTVGTLAQLAAIEALRHPDRLAERIRANREGLSLITASLVESGYQVPVSDTNFVYFNPRIGGEAVRQGLMERGVIVRDFGDAIRVTVGTPAENTRFLAALSDVDSASR